MTSRNEITTNRAAQPTTRRSTQRSNPSTPEHETRPAIQMMKSQPESQSQDLKTTTDQERTLASRSEGACGLAPAASNPVW